MGDTVEGVCYRWPFQEEEADKTFFGQLEEATHLQAFHLKGDLNDPDIFWRGNTEGIHEISGTY